MPFFSRRFRGRSAKVRSRYGREPRRIGQTSRQTRFEQLEERTLLTGDFGYALGFGGSGYDLAQAQEVATDSLGNVYLTGLIDGTVDFDPGPGVTTSSGDVFVVKYSPDGDLLWLKDFSGPFGDLFGPIAVDDAGNVHVTGSFDGTADFDPGPGVYELTTPNFARAVFVLKLDSAGEFAWAGRLGGTGYSNGWGIAVDGAGNVAVAGHFEGRGDFDPGPGTAFLDSAGLRDVFVCKLNAAGEYVWAGRMGGPEGDEGRGVAVDSAGNVYTTGVFVGTADFDPGPETFPLGTAGWDDAFISKLDSAGNLVWARHVGGRATDIAEAIAVDSRGDVYTTGSFWGDGDFDPGPGTFMLPDGGGAEVYVSKLDTDGNFVWAQSLGGNATDNGRGVTLDGGGNVYTTGYFQDTADFDPGPGTVNLSSAGGDDVFLCALDAATGNYVWAGSMGGVRNDQGSSVAADSTGNVYGTGFFGGTADFDPGPEVFNLVGAGSADAFLVKLTGDLTNHPPTDIALSSSSVIEHSPDGTTVGNLSAIDTDVGDTHAYVLLNDAAGRFQVAGNQLRVANGSLLNAGSTHDVTVRATDSGGLTFDETFTVTVTSAGGQGDILMHAFTADGYTTVSVTYQIAVATVDPFEIGFRLSSDEAFDPGDQLLGAIPMSNPADLSVGQHQKTFTIGAGIGQVALPGAGAAETDGDYFLLAVADPTDAVAEADADPFNEDNTVAFAGVYHPAGSDVFVHGSADAEALTVSPGSLRLEVDGDVIVYPGGDVTGLRVRGHGGADSFDFTYGAGFGTSGTFGLLVHGGAGEDSAELTGSPGDDTAKVYPDSATFSGPGFEMSLNSTTEVTVHGGGGNDDASLYDSADNDVFVGSPYNGELSGPTFRSTAEGFNIIHAYGLTSDTDSDIASIDDSSGSDKLKADSTYAKLYNSQFLVRAKGFGTTHVYARNGGYDTARLLDSGGNDKVKAEPDSTKMYGPGYFVRAKFFDEMTAYASDGVDQIRFYDSAENDKFIGTDAKTRLYSTVQKSGFSPYDNTGRRFDQVIAYSTVGGVDKARFLDTTGTDEFRGRSHKSTFQGPGVDYTVRKFEEVYAFSSNGGNDIAKFHDTAGDDYLEAHYTEDNATWAAMWAGGQTQDLLYDVTGFPRVKAYQSEGPDTADLAANVGYVELQGQWQTTGSDQAFKFLGPYPTPLTVSFIDKSGTNRQVHAFPGQVELFAASQTPAETITSLVASWGGNVLGQLPGSGYYLAGVPAGAEAVFIESANGSSAVDFAAPHVVATRGFLTDLNDWTDGEGILADSVNLGGSVGTNTAMYYDDDFVNATGGCSANPTHGGVVAFVGSQGLAGGSGRINTGRVGESDFPSDATATAVDLFLADVQQNDYKRAVINVSSYGSPFDDTGNPLPANVAADNIEVWLRGRAEQLNELSDEQLEQTLFVTITGNGIGNAGRTGIDLAAALNRLHNDFPRLFPADGGPHLMVVGGTQTGSTDPDTGWNFSTDDDDANGNPLVVYAPSRNVTISADGCTASGTSVAAPAVSNLLVRSLIRHPELTVGQVSRAFMDAYRRKGYVLPTLDEIDEQIGAPVLWIYNTEVAEAGTGETTQAIFNVTLSKPASGPVTFSYGTSDGTAEDGIDYRGITGANVGTIPAGWLSTTITVEVIGDDEDESDETFLVHLGDLTNARPGILHETATIRDDDTAGVVVSPTSGLETTEDGGTAQFTIKLTSAPTKDVTVILVSTDTSEGNILSANPRFTAGNWSQPQTITIKGQNDDETDGDQAYTILVGPSSQDPKYNIFAYDVALVNRDNDGVGRFDGSYTGSYSGTANVPGFGSFPVNGGVAFTVTNGVINVTAPEAGSGTVSPTGSANFGSAGGSVGNATFSGSFAVAPSGAVSASGGWTSTISGGGSASGSWTAARNALMAPERYIQASPGSAVLTQEALEPIASEAIARWGDEGIGSSAMDVLNRLSFQIVDLPGSHLGLAVTDAIYFDRDATGYGWFVDSTPGLDEEFRLLGDAGLPAVDDGPAVGRVDLLTVVLHEMGHLLGLGDLDPLDDPDNLMNEILPPGIRRLPSPAELDAVFADDS